MGSPPTLVYPPSLQGLQRAAIFPLPPSPVATCTRDLPISSIPISPLTVSLGAADPPSDLSRVGDGLAGGSEEESAPSPLSRVSLPAHMMAANPERWEQAVKETEAWMKEMERISFF